MSGHICAWGLVAFACYLPTATKVIEMRICSHAVHNERVRLVWNITATRKLFQIWL